MRTSRWASLVVAVPALTACPLLGPDCLEPEKRYDYSDPAYVVDLKPQVPIQSTAEHLANEYGFVVSKIRDEEWLSTKGFTVNSLPKEAFEGLHCEAVVQRIWHNGRIAPLYRQAEGPH